MRVSTLKLSAVALLAATTLLAAPAAMAVDLDAALLARGGGGGGKPGGGDGGDGGGDPAPQPGTSACAKAAVDEGTMCWLSVDVGQAHSDGYMGKGTYVTFVDDFESGDTFAGNWGEGMKALTHGGWTLSETQIVAPDATYSHQDFSVDAALAFHDDGLDVVNASYGMIGFAKFYHDGALDTYLTEKSIIDAAWNGDAVVSKAAGNDGIAVGGSIKGKTDYLGNSLIGAQTAIFVGALDFNGSPTNLAPMSYYSNYAGSDVDVQNQFLVVGVDYKATGLAGTSFAAPIVAGYAAILGSKFTMANETQVASQLLETARTDTIFGYSVAIHGQGEACLSCALAPDSIN